MAGYPVAVRCALPEVRQGQCQRTGPAAVVSASATTAAFTRAPGWPPVDAGRTGPDHGVGRTDPHGPAGNFAPRIGRDESRTVRGLTVSLVDM